MPDRLKQALFLMFLLSGFSSLLYQVVWLRLAFASFGIITPVLSLVISMFMLGLALGSWGAGSVAQGLTRRTGISAIVFYGIAELVIGASAFIVPRLFMLGEEILLTTGEMDSFEYLTLSALIVAASILPFCICMGTTFPLMMAFVRERSPTASTSFSFLYLANVIGAMAGTLLTALVLVELFGFTQTLYIGALGNFVVAVAGFRLGLRGQTADAATVGEGEAATSVVQPLAPSAARLVSTILFTTGFASMALEVVWTRAFTPVLKTQVYSFASLLFTYLLATWVGSYVYRRHISRGGGLSTTNLLNLVALSAFLQIILDDPRLQRSPLLVLISIFPFCGLLGYLTPKLIDEFSVGRPRQAGHAYALNVMGSIAGPLFASYVLLPTVGVKWSSVVFACSILVLALVARTVLAETRSRLGNLWLAATGAALLVSASYSTSYEELYASRDGIVRRDHTATVISHITDTGALGLIVNGKEITGTTPTTKIMAHMPLAFLEEEPESALVICFGMGTTYRSLMSWGISATAVELVPSVRDAFGYYFDDTEEILNDSRGHIVIDDGRRFLKRTEQKFDVITLDPPPPPEAAGSSLLYSKEFYALVNDRLTERGILHQWFPGGDRSTFYAVVRSLSESFPHVEAYRAYDKYGIHMLASRQPISKPSVSLMIERMPASAQADLMEWSPNRRLERMVGRILDPGLEVMLDELLEFTPTQTITDDRPFNEYYALRRLWQNFTQTYEIVL